MCSRLYSMILLPLFLFATIRPVRPPVPAGGLSGSNKGRAVGREVIELKQPSRNTRPSFPVRPPSEEKITGSACVLEGRVIDSRTGKPIEGAEISVPEVDLRTVSGKDGRFSLSNIPPRGRTYEILVTCTGYKSYFADQRFEAGRRYLRDYPLRPVGW